MNLEKQLELRWSKGARLNGISGSVQERCDADVGPALRVVDERAPFASRREGTPT
jgi:hypothetical protein